MEIVSSDGYPLCRRIIHTLCNIIFSINCYHLHHHSNQIVNVTFIVSSQMDFELFKSVKQFVCLAFLILKYIAQMVIALLQLNWNYFWIENNNDDVGRMDRIQSTIIRSNNNIYCIISVFRSVIIIINVIQFADIVTLYWIVCTKMVW